MLILLFLFTVGATHSDFPLKAEFFKYIENVPQQEPNDILQHTRSEQKGAQRFALNPTHLDFGFCRIRYAERSIFSITNLNSNESVILSSSELNNEAFLLTGFERTILYPSSTEFFNVTFVPQAIGKYEGEISFDTSVGVIRYPLFGVGFFDMFQPFPRVTLTRHTGAGFIISSEFFNPTSYFLKLDLMGPFPTVAPSTEDVTSDESQTLPGFPQYFVIPPFTHRIVAESPLAMKTPNFKGNVFFSVRHYESLSDLSSNNFSNVGQHILKTTVAFPHHLFEGSDFFSGTDFVHFGTVTRQKSTVVRSLTFFNHAAQDIHITHIFTEPWTPALTVRLANHSKLETTAVLTISAEHIPQSHVCSGFIVVLTNSGPSGLRIPFYAQLIDGYLNIRTANMTDGLTGLWHQFILRNHADVPVLVMPTDLPDSLMKVATVYLRQSSTIILQPDEELVLLNVSVRAHSYTPKPVELTVVTNASTLPLSVEAFSGRIEVVIPSAFSVNGVFDFGHVIDGQSTNACIRLINFNPFKIDIERFMLATFSSSEKIVTDDVHCVAQCHLSKMDQICIGCVTHLDPLSNVTYPLLLKGSEFLGDVTGFILLQTPYERLVQHFRFRVDIGSLTMEPGSIILDDVFPGRIVHRHLTVTNNYPEAVNLTHFGVTPLHEPEDVELNLVNLSHSVTSLPPQDPVVVGTIVINASVRCVDILSNEIDASRPSEPEICFTGFNLDTLRGNQYLLSLIRNESALARSDIENARFFNGLLHTAHLFRTMQNTWSRKQDKSPFSSGFHAFVEIGTVNSSTRTPVSLSYNWPSLFVTERPANLTSSNCYLAKSLVNRMSTFNFSTLLQPSLTARLPSIRESDSVHCDLLIRNPSDRPLLVQPILLNSLLRSMYNRSDGNLTASMALLFDTLGVHLGQDAIDELLRRFNGLFSVNILDLPSGSAKLFEPLPDSMTTPPCCPLIMLLPRVGEVHIRLSFTMDSSPEAELLNWMGGPMDLLFLRNNLTALESVWVRVNTEKAAFAIGASNDCGFERKSAVSTGRVAALHGFASCAHPSLLLQGVWNQTKVSVDGGNHTCSNWVLNNTLNEASIPAVTYSLTERQFYPLCSEPVDLEVADLTSISVAIDQLQLKNTGDVPLHISMLIPGPDPQHLSGGFSIMPTATTSNRSLACAYNSVLLSPCLTPSSSMTVDEKPLLNKLLVEPGGSVRFSVNYMPNFVHLSHTVTLWLQVIPEGTVQDRDSGISHTVNMSAALPFLKLEVRIPRPLFTHCMDMLPRPLFEQFLWLPTVLLFIATFLFSLFLGSVDAQRLYTKYMRAKEIIDSLSFAAIPDVSSIVSCRKTANGTTYKSTPDLKEQLLSASCRIIRRKTRSPASKQEVMVLGTNNRSLCQSWVTRFDWSRYRHILSKILFPLMRLLLILLSFLSWLCFYGIPTFISRVTRVCSGQSLSTPHSLKSSKKTASNELANPVRTSALPQATQSIDNTKNMQSVYKVRTRAKRVFFDENKTKGPATRSPQAESRPSCRRKKTSKQDDETAQSLAAADRTPSSNSDSNGRHSFSMSEAQIAAAVRATIRLSEETSNKGRKKTLRTRKKTASLEIPDSSSSSCGDASGAEGTTAIKDEVVNFVPISEQNNEATADTGDVPAVPTHSRNFTPQPAEHSQLSFSRPNRKPRLVELAKDAHAIRPTMFPRKVQAGAVLRLPWIPAVLYPAPFPLANHIQCMPLHPLHWDNAVARVTSDLDTSWIGLQLNGFQPRGFQCVQPIEQLSCMDALNGDESSLASILGTPDLLELNGGQNLYGNSLLPPDLVTTPAGLPPSIQISQGSFQQAQAENRTSLLQRLTVDTLDDEKSAPGDSITECGSQLDAADSIPCSPTLSPHHFYELTQITHERLLCMLKHESRDVSSGQLEEHPFLDFLTKSEQSQTDTSSATHTPESPTDHTSNYTYQPWVSIESIPNDELFRSFELDQTEQLLDMGPSFSYLEIAGSSSPVDLRCIASVLPE